MDYETIVIPKGTLLFRGMNSTATLTSDFAGMLVDDKKFCLNPNYNVFFYPFPFIAATVAAYQYTVIYVTMRDLKLVNLILPSKFNREGRTTKTGGIVSCDTIAGNCGVSGRSYDPCVDYTKVSGDISGMIAIAKVDADSLNLNKLLLRSLENKYFTTYKDSRNVVGVPEFILHPRFDKTPQTETISDFKQWYSSNKSKFNYNYLHLMSYKPLDVQVLMDEFMSEGGLDLGDDEPYHLKINNKTGFFQIEEFSNNRSELIAPNLTIKPTADMVFKQKSLYKVLSDKYPKTDTVPSVVTQYFLKRDHVGFGKDGQDWLTKFMDKPMSLSLVMQPPEENVQRSIYHIDNKQYVFTLTPTGKKLLADAAIAGDDSIYAESGVTGHPINSQISAYEVFPVNTGASVILYNISNTPARHINGLLQYYAQKNGLLGASRRRTRRRRLLKSR
jgi:hypothetical protein